ncbi:MAG: hypothetical protein HY352_01215 [Candidatus Omnitrophica bacterium]|nr:hypothetical protein [Candidatus Omnitrophota bacterium]
MTREHGTCSNASGFPSFGDRYAASLPRMRPSKHVNESPQVVILGSGASKAACPLGDKSGRQLPLMHDLVKVIRLEAMLAKVGIDHEGKNFEELFSDLYEERGRAGIVIDLENAVRRYFSSMALPDEVTVYDKLLLSLRKKDLIATFNWDPFLVQAYVRNRTACKGNTPEIVHLHGDVATGYCGADRIRDYVGTRCPKCGEALTTSPLLYPIKKKNYAEDPFIKNQWEGFQTYLGAAYLVTIFGYSAPETDVEAVEAMYGVWRDNPHKELAQIEIIDIRPSRELLPRWERFIVRDHVSPMRRFEDSWLARHPRRSCDSFADATLQNDPWRNNPFPDTKDLHSLQTWLLPLIEEEIGYSERDEAFRTSPLSQSGKIL